MEENFTDWLIQHRLEWLIEKSIITSDEAMEAELSAGLAQDGKELTSNEKACLALFTDRVVYEREIVYRQGILDGIRLVKEADKI